jgi:cell wall-associated NlpC family hydrolase
MWSKVLNSFITSFVVILLGACTDVQGPHLEAIPEQAITATLPKNNDTPAKPPVTLPPTAVIETGLTNPAELVAFAKTLIGTSYCYASTDKEKGFDCSGFVTYVFNHFNVAVPRSSVDFTNVGKEIDYHEAGPGDIILFTGTDSTIRVVGHMGIVVSNQNDSLQFIHSSSGKANGVIITTFERYYKSRFVKVIRIFPNEFFRKT